VRTILAAAGGLCLLTACGHDARSPVAGGDAARGKTDITAMACGACHVIGGIPGADGQVGPPLNGLAQRVIIGGTLPNTPENMMLWIEDPPAIAPYTAMPNLGVTPQQARDITAYLYSVK
jgi:cytochrome c2